MEVREIRKYTDGGGYHLDLACGEQIPAIVAENGNLHVGGEDRACRGNGRGLLHIDLVEKSALITNLHHILPEEVGDAPADCLLTAYSVRTGIRRKLRAGSRGARKRDNSKRFNEHPCQTLERCDAVLIARPVRSAEAACATCGFCVRCVSGHGFNVGYAD